MLQYFAQTDPVRLRRSFKVTRPSQSKALGIPPFFRCIATLVLSSAGLVAAVTAIAAAVAAPIALLFGFPL